MNDNNAAQAATPSVLTEAERRQLLVRANYPPLQEEPRAYLVKITEELVLSKLCAPIAMQGALRWTAGALQALKIEADRIKLDSVTRTIGEILDDADAALASAPMIGFRWSADDLRASETRAKEETWPTTAQIDALAEFIYQDMGCPSNWLGFDKEAARRLLSKPVEIQAIPASAEAQQVVAWVHEEDANRVISARQKAQAERDGGAYASSLRPYSIPLARIAAP